MRRPESFESTVSPGPQDPGNFAWSEDEMSVWREIVTAVSTDPGTVPGLEPLELVGDESKPAVRNDDAGVRQTSLLVRDEPEPGRIAPAGLTEFQDPAEGVAALSVLLGLSISVEE